MEGPHDRGLKLTDVLSPKWNAKKALLALRSRGKEEIGDVLLDQELFAGVGNIIKNEVFSRVRIRPDALIRNLSVEKRKEIVAQARSFSKDFLKWRRIFQLRKHLLVHRKKVCPHCGGPLVHGKKGKKQRMAHCCPRCQKKTSR